MTVIVSLLAIAVIGTGLLLLRPTDRLLDFVSEQLGGALLRVPTRERAIALTFDDAPSPGLTRDILARLAADDARATFFVIGSYAARYPESMDAIRRDGHELANHLYTDRRSAALSDTEFVEELRMTDALLFPPRKGEVQPDRKWCRPGHGELNRRLVRLMRADGYDPVLATMYPLDLRLPVGLTVRHVEANLRPGAIFVLHDGSDDRRRTLDVLDRLLPSLRSRGFRLVTLSELTRLSTR